MNSNKILIYTACHQISKVSSYNANPLIIMIQLITDCQNVNIVKWSQELPNQCDNSNYAMMLKHQSLYPFRAVIPPGLRKRKSNL